MRHINSKKVKYKKMKPIVEKEFENGEHIILYINLNSIISSFYSKRIANKTIGLKGNEKLVITLTLLDIIGDSFSLDLESHLLLYCITIMVIEK